MTFDKGKQSQLEDNLLWQGLRAGDATAFKDIIHKYTPYLFSYGIRFTEDQDIVKDCIQELFVEVWNKRNVIVQPTSVKWYLYVAIRNRVFREKGKWNKTDVLCEGDYEFHLEYSIESKMIEYSDDLALAKKIKIVLESLPPRQREIVYLRYYQNLDYDQIASIMNISKQSVHNLLQKAYKNFRGEWTVMILALIDIFLLE